MFTFRLAKSLISPYMIMPGNKSKDKENKEYHHNIYNNPISKQILPTIASVSEDRE